MITQIRSEASGVILGGKSHQNDQTTLWKFPKKQGSHFFRTSPKKNSFFGKELNPEPLKVCDHLRRERQISYYNHHFEAATCLVFGGCIRCRGLPFRLLGLGIFLAPLLLLALLTYVNKKVENMDQPHRIRGGSI